MLSKRRVKIVATIGPSTHSKENLKRCILAGMNVARLNFSHGNHEDHRKVIEHLRDLSKELQAPVSVLQDLQGPKIRVGRFKNGSINLEKNQEVVLTTEKVEGENGLIPLDFDGLPNVCGVNQVILLDDGLLELVVTSVNGQKIHAKVKHGGILKDRKGLNVPGLSLPVEGLTAKDVEDLKFGIEQQVDYVALSFVRTAQDVQQLKEKLKSAGSDARIVSKIEMFEAIENLEEIVDASDAVMVARGDLAIEIGNSQLPVEQKKIVKLCNKRGKPVIVATQMLDSMVENPRPTRAEVTDVANGVLDGSDALMLSAETASGNYPFRCIRTMHEIVQEVENSYSFNYLKRLESGSMSVAESIAASACLTAQNLDASAIVCLTTTGKTATMISRYRPNARIIALTHIIPTLNRLEVSWGIQTLPIDNYESSDEAMDHIEDKLLAYGLVEPGDKVILTFGAPVLEQAKTNTLRVYQVGDRKVGPSSRDDLPLRVRDIIPLGDIEPS